MKAPLPAVLVLFLLASGLHGCATSKVAGHERTTVLGGLVEVSRNDYTPPSPATVPVDGRLVGREDKPTGTKSSLFWGLISYTKY
jgi:hypothetical protein